MENQMELRREVSDDEENTPFVQKLMEYSVVQRIVKFDRRNMLICLIVSLLVVAACIGIYHNVSEGTDDAMDTIPAKTQLKSEDINSNDLVSEEAEDAMDTFPAAMQLKKEVINSNDLGVLDSVDKDTQAPEASKKHLDDTPLLDATSKQIVNSPSLGCGRNPLLEQFGADMGPWVVAVGTKTNGLFSVHGNGILVSSQHVIMEASRDHRFKITHVQLGTRRRVPDPHAEERQIIRTSFPPELLIRDHLRYHGFNIAILTLSSPVQFDAFTQPACLPDPITNLTAHSIGYTEGASIYGIDIEILSQSPVIAIGEKYAIKHDHVSYLGPFICKFIVENEPEILNAKVADFISPWTLCVPTIHGSQILSSTLLKEDSDGRMTLIGVGAIALKSLDVPTMYSSVALHLDWINSVIKSYPSHG